ncbi:MAG TPA: bifunctional 2-C-methyl-D-erythritol 4-phosphate cytidylyltransferase/2-C-methyl-D-erythritol 2,4-cyclodiphosphate synthase, partial [Alphaproteobacteria bacterium]|nr:bifunctional 2-C-methyl-D-erythritol 4-phosphate cytidylyltransferase/2-C-methyl-D-erythritol 2,4-cyclodiphosphate synthase [Alphaproteobacteria bacterium]
MTECVALVVAAGRGTRAGGALPKQYRDLGGRAVLRWSLERFRRHPRVGAVRAVIHPDDRALYDAAAAGLDLLPPVHGGATRQDSVRLGLESLASLRPQTVLIHDAARPFFDDATIDRTIDALAQSPGAIVAVPVTDTIKRGKNGRIGGTVDRAGLWRAQTPQGFRFDAILAAHRAALGAELSDDAAVAERAGLPVALVPGSEMNTKLTSEDDLRRAALLAGVVTETRVGSGFDVHAFGPGDHVWLCGIKIPHSEALVGHSDADVALHALTDAILGAIGAADIGAHFPPSDPRWRGAASDKFLAHAVSLLTARGGTVVHADVTIICERPKIGPHRAAMIERLAAILGVDNSRCSVKATTTEGLGFTGRGEGIAVQAVA